MLRKHMIEFIIVAENERKAEVQMNLEYLRELKEKRKSLRSRLRKAEGLERKVLKAKSNKVYHVCDCLGRHAKRYGITVHVNPQAELTNFVYVCLTIYNMYACTHQVLVN
jgi:hypothetical protein